MRILLESQLALGLEFRNHLMIPTGSLSDLHSAMPPYMCNVDATSLSSFAVDNFPADVVCITFLTCLALP